MLLKELLNNLLVLPFDIQSSFIASKLSADLSKKGEEINLGDVLVLGIMKANNCSEIVTRDEHFSRIKGIKVIGY